MHEIVFDRALVHILHLDAVSRRIIDIVAVVMHVAAIDRVVPDHISFDVISPEMDPITEVFDLQIFYNHVIMPGIEYSCTLIIAIGAISGDHAVQRVAIAIDHDTIRTDHETVS